MRNIGKIIRVSRPLYPWLFAIAFLIIVSAGLELIIPVISKSIVDEIVAKISGAKSSPTNLYLLIGLTFLVHLAGVIASGLSDRLGDHFAGQQRKLLTSKFYDRVLSLPQSYFDSEISGKIVNQLSRGIFTIQNFTNAATNFILPTFLQSGLTVLLLSRYSPPVALFVFMLFPIYLTLSYYSSKKWGEAETAKNQLEDKMRGRIQEVIGNIKIVKGFLTERREWQFVSESLDKINKIFAVQSTMYHKIDFVRNLSLVIILLGINLVVFSQAYQKVISIGEMVLIIQLVLAARRPLFAMSFILTQLQNAESGSKEFFEILELPASENYRDTGRLINLSKPIIRFDRVSFAYQGSGQILSDISFTIKPKETVALVGHSGAGKTTITNLILALYKPTSGQIFLNNKPYNSLTLAEIRHNVGLVFQENELMSTSIRENVAYGSRANEIQIEAALKTANAWGFVEKLPQGLDSQVGERGVKLSGGQKQRIQIARAILKNAPILILDEATSNLDARSEAEVQEGLSRLMRDKLVIIIAHRFSTLQSADRVIVLADGRIDQEGDPGSLARQPGTYRDLISYQIAGDKKLLAGFELS